MSALFGGTNTTGQYLSAGSALAGSGATPMSFSAWYRHLPMAQASTNMSLVASSATAGGAHGSFELFCSSALAQLRCGATNSTGTAGTTSPGPVYVKGVWGHAGAVFASTTSRTVYKDGLAAVTNATSITVTGLDNTTIGTALVNGGVGDVAKGLIAEVGIWNIALTAQEVAQLAAGYRPDQIRQDHLLSYMPLKTNGFLYDRMGRVWTTVGFVQPYADHPPMIVPKRRKTYLFMNTVTIPAFFPSRNRIILEGESL